MKLSLSDEVLDEVARRIVEVAKPERIVLFGSGARGQSSESSDLDLLVVKGGAHRRRLAQEIYVGLIGVGRPVDMVVVTPEDIERFGDYTGSDAVDFEQEVPDMAGRRTPLKPSSKVGGDPKEWARKAKAFQEKLAASGRAFGDSTEIVRADRDSRI